MALVSEVFEIAKVQAAYMTDELTRTFKNDTRTVIFGHIGWLPMVSVKCRYLTDAKAFV